MRFSKLFGLGLVMLALALFSGSTWAQNIGGGDIVGAEPDNTDCLDDDDDPGTPPIENDGDPCDDDGANFGSPSTWVGRSDCKFQDHGTAERDTNAFLSCLLTQTAASNTDADLTVVDNGAWGIDLVYDPQSGKVLDWVCYYEGNKDLHYAGVRTDVDDRQAKIRMIDDTTLFDPSPVTITLTLKAVDFEAQPVVLQLFTAPNWSLNTRLKNAIVAAGFSADIVDGYINVSQFDSIPPRGIAFVSIETDDPGIWESEVALVGDDRIDLDSTPCSPAP